MTEDELRQQAERSPFRFPFTTEEVRATLTRDDALMRDARQRIVDAGAAMVERALAQAILELPDRSTPCVGLFVGPMLTTDDWRIVRIVEVLEGETQESIVWTARLLARASRAMVPHGGTESTIYWLRVDGVDRVVGPWGTA